VRGNPEATKPSHIFDHRGRLSSKRKRSRSHVERNVVTAVRADLDAIEAQHVFDVLRGTERARPVAVVGEDHEAKPGARRRACDLPAIGRSV
jgi:hypothetical protein